MSLHSDKDKSKLKDFQDFLDAQKSKGNAANVFLMQTMLDLLLSHNYRLETLEREVLPSESFINPLDGGPSRIV